MAIQNRRGNYGDFDKSKMLAGEFAIVLQDDPDTSDGKAVYMAFSPGSAKRLATYEDMVSDLEAATAEATARAEAAAAESIEQSAEQITTNTEDIAELKDDLTAEQTARENADTALQTSINNEKTAREAYGFSVVNGILNVTYTTTEVGGE